MTAVFRAEDGQATVELALAIPVCIVVALVIVNALVYATYCIKFDLEAAQCVVSHGVSVSGSSDLRKAAEQVKSSLQTAMGERVEVSVAYESAVRSGSSLFSFVPGHVKFVCTMRYVPYPLSVSVAGVPWSAASLSHSMSMVVDVGCVG